MDSKIGKKVLWSSEIVSLTKLLVADGPDISNYTQCELTAELTAELRKFISNQSVFANIYI